MARIAAELGVPDPPRTEAELADRIARFRPELAATSQAREAARFLLLSSPLALIAQGEPTGCWPPGRYRCCPNGRVSRSDCPAFRLPSPCSSARAGHAMVRTIRWATGPAPARPTRRSGNGASVGRSG